MTLASDSKIEIPLQRTRRGTTLLYCIFIIPVIMAFASIAVDMGRAQLAKTQLQHAVDAAARYAATGLADSSYISKAQTSAAENVIDGSPLTLQNSDIEAGTWDSTAKTFTPGGGSPNAIRVTGHRTSARGSGIPTIFAQAIGRTTVDVKATSIVLAPTVNTGYDVVGLNQVSLTGGAQIKRWSSESGTVNVATNGSTTVPWGTYIYGNVYYRTSTPSEPGNGISGTLTSMSSNIDYTTIAKPSGGTNIGKEDIGWAGKSYAAGTYDADDVRFKDGGTINFLGDVTLKCKKLEITGGAIVNCYGNLTIYSSDDINIDNGAIINTSGTSKVITLYMTSNRTATFNMSSTFYMRIYGPDSTVNLTGSSPLVGSVIAKNLNLSGSATISYSSALASPYTNSTGPTLSSSGSGSIATVR